MLEGLSVEAEGSTSGYSRDLFPHWIIQTGNCDTREVVLQRDGTGVTVDSACRPISGSWYSVPRCSQDSPLDTDIRTRFPG